MVLSMPMVMGTFFGLMAEKGDLDFFLVAILWISGIAYARHLELG
jgi:hypothetical protein